MVKSPNELPRHAVCETATGDRFICDTNYHLRYKKDLDELLDDVTEKHICLTGGEPFLHDVREFYIACLERDLMLHIETSGTHDIVAKLGDLDGRGRRFPMWITCSPKRGFVRKNIQVVDEWKFVCGPDFDPLVLGNFFDYPEGRAARAYSRPIYLQPVNRIGEIDRHAINRVIQILGGSPQYRLSVQLHKLLELP